MMQFVSMIAFFAKFLLAVLNENAANASQIYIAQEKAVKICVFLKLT
jgi:hypothetical protein